MADIDWHETGGEMPQLRGNEMIFVRGRYGHVYGPVPFELIDPEAWTGNMFHASLDLSAWSLADG